MLSALTFLLYASTTIVLGAPVSSSSTAVPSISSSSSNSSVSSNVNTTLSKYAPPTACIGQCDALMADLGKCSDDSCVCTQDGLNHFASCAACDTRISTFHGEVNVNVTLTRFSALCEKEGYSMANVTFPANATSSTNSTTTASDKAAATPIMLTSAAYASLSIASGTGMVTVEGQLAASSAAPTVQVQLTGGSIRNGAWSASFAALLILSTAVLA